MLRRLRIRDFALLDSVDVEFGAGLNVLTGETGAGKSILIDSVALLLGGRASVDTIRLGADTAVLEAVFEHSGEEVVVRREIHRDRSSRVEIDGALSTVRMLRALCSDLAQLHGQHDDVLLTKPDRQRQLLDAFAGAQAIAIETRHAASRLAELHTEIEDTRATREERSRRLELLRHEKRQIDGAEIEIGEDASLEQTMTLLNNALDRSRLVSEISDAIDGGDGSIDSLLGALQRAIDALADRDPSLSPISARAADLRHELRDLARDVERYGSMIESDPERLELIESRLTELNALKRRFGPTLEDVVSRSEALGSEIEALETTETREGSLEKARAEAEAALVTAASALAMARQTAAGRLETAVRERLADLGVGDGEFRVALHRVPSTTGIEFDGKRYAWTAAGLERVEFQIAPNRGEGLRALAKVASGGELSRILLAIKAALADADATPTLVFDEIDAGIGGAVAHRVAAQLQSVGQHHQVIVVTHLAQIAAVADRHIVVEKKAEGDRTVSMVTLVEGEDRVVEVSRLLSGDPERDVAREHAQELLGDRA